MQLRNEWFADEPNNGTRTRCTSMKLIDGKWQAVECFDRKPYVCELGFIHHNSTTTTAAPSTPSWQQTTASDEPAWMTTLDTLAPETTTDALPSASTAPPEVSTNTPEQTTAEPTTLNPRQRQRPPPPLPPPLRRQRAHRYIEEWEGGADQCYNVFASTGWLQDQAKCEENNGSLISIHNAAKFLKTFIFRTKATAGKVDVSIGLKEVFEGNARVWAWVDESPFDYRNWMDGFPKEAKEGEALRCATYYSQVASYDPDFGPFLLHACSSINRLLSGRWKHVNCETAQARAVCEREPDWEPEEEVVFPNRAGREGGRIRSRLLTRAERVSQ
ncbi:hypothetical protein M3Y99_00052700 [Aphelenchoides fujianensis]|nr:hypothetical protein M3Y99_00052700 [Aphelenchoides fujianensis]